MVGGGRGRGRGALEDQQTEMAEMRRMIEDLARAVQALQGQERREAPDGDPNPSEDESEGNPEDEQDVHNPFHDVAGLGEPASFNYEDEDTNKEAITDDCLCEICCGNCGVEEDKDANKDAIKALNKDIDNNFVDFNTFLMQTPKAIVNLVNEINDGKRIFGTARLKLKRKFIDQDQAFIPNIYLFGKEEFNCKLICQKKI
ncbi:hypothetical protein ACLB2K_028016 [Fragaria x ananassa]